MMWFKSYYKGALIELSARDALPHEWSASFEIPDPISLSVRPGLMTKSGFKTQEDALKWTRQEIDHIRKTNA